MKKLARVLSPFCGSHFAPVAINNTGFVVLSCIEHRGKQLSVRIAGKLENVIGKFGKTACGSLLSEGYRLADCAQVAK